MSQRAPFYKHLYSYPPSCQPRPWGSSFLSQSGTRSQQNPPSPSVPCPGWDAIDLTVDTWLHTKLPEATTEGPSERAEQMAGVPLEVKVLGQGFKWQPRTWQSIPCPRDGAVPTRGLLWTPTVGTAPRWRTWVLAVTKAPRAAPHLRKQFKARQPPSAGERFATASDNSPKCPATSELAILGTSWLQSLCRWEAERHWETPILHPSRSTASCVRGSGPVPQMGEGKQN